MRQALDFLSPIEFRYTLENQVAELLDTLCLEYERNLISKIRNCPVNSLVEGMEVDFQLKDGTVIEVNGPKHFVFHTGEVTDQMVGYTFAWEESSIKFGVYRHLLARFKSEVLAKKGLKVVQVDFYENMSKSLPHILTDKLGLK
jgi:hypothetical protein